MEKEETIKMRDTFREVSEILDEIIIFEEKIDNNEEIDENEYKSKLGLFTYKMMELMKTMD